MSWKTSEFYLTTEMSAPVSSKNTSSFPVATWLNDTNMFWLRLTVWTLAFSTVKYLWGFVSFPMYYWFGYWLLGHYFGYYCCGLDSSCHGLFSFLYIGVVQYCFGYYCCCNYYYDHEKYLCNFLVRGFRRAARNFCNKGQCLAVLLLLWNCLQIFIWHHS